MKERVYITLSLIVNFVPLIDFLLKLIIQLYDTWMNADIFETELEPKF